jgi:hypothetical protein
MPTEAEIRADESIAPAPEERPTYTEAQQKHIESLIRSSMGRAAHGLREELAVTRAEAAITEAELALYKSAANPELAATRAQLATETVARTAAEQRELDARKNAALFEACQAENIIAPKDAVKLLSDSVVWKDGALVSAEGGEPLASLARDFAASRPHLVRSSVRAGIGSSAAERPFNTGAPKLESLFGKGSDGAAANRLALRDPKEYGRLRALAREKGLLP